MKPIFITLLYLASSGDIKMDRFEIFSSCNSWFHINVIKEQNRKYDFFKRRHYYKFNNKKVVGYVCSYK